MCCMDLCDCMTRYNVCVCFVFMLMCLRLNHFADSDTCFLSVVVAFVLVQVDWHWWPSKVVIFWVVLVFLVVNDDDSLIHVMKFDLYLILILVLGWNLQLWTMMDFCERFSSNIGDVFLKRLLLTFSDINCLKLKEKF